MSNMKNRTAMAGIFAGTPIVGPTPPLAVGDRVRMTTAGIARDCGGQIRAETGRVVGFSNGYVLVRRDGDDAAGAYFPESWQKATATGGR